jgi:hypothetical protein
MSETLRLLTVNKEPTKLLTMTAKRYDELLHYTGWPNGYANQLFDELRAQAARVQALEAENHRLTGG